MKSFLIVTALCASGAALAQTLPSPPTVSAPVASVAAQMPMTHKAAPVVAAAAPVAESAAGPAAMPARVASPAAASRARHRAHHGKRHHHGRKA